MNLFPGGAKASGPRVRSSGTFLRLRRTKLSTRGDGPLCRDQWLKADVGSPPLSECVNELIERDMSTTWAKSKQPEMDDSLGTGDMRNDNFAMFRMSLAA